MAEKNTVLELRVYFNPFQIYQAAPQKEVYLTSKYFLDFWRYLKKKLKLFSVGVVSKTPTMISWLICHKKNVSDDIFVEQSDNWYVDMMIIIIYVKKPAWEESAFRPRSPSSLISVMLCDFSHILMVSYIFVIFFGRYFS